jgi:hypothetical protein
MAEIRRLSLIRGNSLTIPVTMESSAGVAYNIKNWVVYFTLKTDHSLPDSQATLQKIITTFSDTTSGTTGIANIPLVETDTQNLAVGEYDFDIKVLTAGTLGTSSYTVMKGKFDLEYNVTDSVGTAGTL